MEDDPRLTAIGRLLARTKLDELPQLWNVLTGEMSIIGPRPESLDFADCFDGPFHSVLEHKPGVFGPNQVIFRDECSLYRERSDPERFYRDILFPLKARVDLSYFANRTFFHDIVWVVRGVFAVFGWSSLVQQGPVLVKEAEDWIGKAEGADSDLASHIGLLIHRRGVLEIVRASGAEVKVLPIGGPYAADQAGTPERGYLQVSAGSRRRHTLGAERHGA